VEHRKPSPDNANERYHDRTKQQSQDTSSNNISLRQYMRMFGRQNDQQARTNEAPTSGLDGQSARQKCMSDINVREEKLVELEAQERMEILNISIENGIDDEIIQKVNPIMEARRKIIDELQQKHNELQQEHNELQKEYNEIHQEYTILGEEWQKLNEFLKEQIKSDQEKQEKIRTIQQERYSLLEEKGENERELRRLRQETGSLHRSNVELQSSVQETNEQYRGKMQELTEKMCGLTEQLQRIQGDKQALRQTIQAESQATFEEFAGKVKELMDRVDEEKRASQDENRHLQEEIDRLLHIDQEKQELERNNQALQHENQNLTDQLNQALQHERMPDTSSREEELAKLEKENEDLKLKIEENRKFFLDNSDDMYQRFVDNYGDVIQDRQTLQNENEMLQSSNQTLLREKEQLREQVGKLNNELRQETNKLQNVINNMGETDKKMLIENEELTRENQILRQTFQQQEEALQHENQNLTDQLKQADQEKKDLEKTIQELTARLNQALQEKDQVAGTSGTSSFEKEDASLSPTGWEVIKSHAEQEGQGHSRNLRQQVDQQKQENENRDKVVQGQNLNVQETHHGRHKQKWSIGQMWHIMGRRGDGAEKQEGQVREQVSLIDRGPQGEETSSPPNIAEQKLRELWDAVNDAKLLDGENSMKFLNYDVCSLILNTKSAQGWLRAKSYDRVIERVENVKNIIENMRNFYVPAYNKRYNDVIKCANEFINTPEGQTWLNSDDGDKFRILDEQYLIGDSTIRGLFLRKVRTAEDFIQHLWDALNNNNNEWSSRREWKFKDNSSCYFILETRVGEKWCIAKHYDTWFEDNIYIGENGFRTRFAANEFINTPEGQAWLNSEDGQKFRILREHGLVARGYL
jgi:predicted  nucleic acid-binding Zn-ribbon protein